MVGPEIFARWWPWWLLVGGLILLTLALVPVLLLPTWWPLWWILIALFLANLGLANTVIPRPGWPWWLLLLALLLFNLALAAALTYLLRRLFRRLFSLRVRTVRQADRQTISMRPRE